MAPPPLGGAAAPRAINGQQHQQQSTNRSPQQPGRANNPQRMNRPQQQHLQPNGHGNNNTSAAGGIASSLDILFSYSRSQMFYGSNLPSSPSFINYTSDHDEEDGSSVTHSQSYDDESYDEEEEDEGYSRRVVEDDESRMFSSDHSPHIEGNDQHGHGETPPLQLSEDDEEEDEEGGPKWGGGGTKTPMALRTPMGLPESPKPGAMGRERSGSYGFGNVQWTPKPIVGSLPLSATGSASDRDVPTTPKVEQRSPQLTPTKATPEQAPSRTTTTTKLTTSASPLPDILSKPVNTTTQSPLSDRNALASHLAAARSGVPGATERTPLLSPSQHAVVGSPSGNHQLLTTQALQAHQSSLSARRGSKLSLRSSVVDFTTDTPDRLLSPNNITGTARRESRLRRPSASSFSFAGAGMGGVGALTSGIGIKRRMSTVVPEEVGTSTFGQTLFNSVAVLIGVGLLSVPIAFSYAGWVLGPILLIFYAAVTNYTAKLLAAVVRRNPSLTSYSEIASQAFGPNGRMFTHLLFCLELGALSVAFVVLFGDSLFAILGHFPVSTYKALFLLLILPTLFLPLRLLSFTSLIGIFSTLFLVVCIVVDGTVKKDAPGSLFDGAVTSIGPNWGQLPLTFGLLMAGFSGHAVMPSLARDMAKPEDFDKMIDIAYVITTVVYMFTGVVGYRMFGDYVSDEFTKDLMATPGYPQLLNKIGLWMIALSPLTKFALCTRPLSVTLERLLNLTSMVDDRNNSRYNQSSLSIKVKERSKEVGRWIARVGLAVLVTVIAISLPQFGQVMSFLGAFSAFLICIIVPILAAKELLPVSSRKPILEWTLFSIGVIQMIVGTVWTFLPEGGLSGKPEKTVAVGL